MKTKTIIFLVLLLAALAFAFIADNWKVDAAKAKVEFTADGPFGKVNGSFSGMKSAINFNPDNLASSSITASIVVNTIETGIGLRNKDLRDKEEWFNAAKYPQITIQSKQFRKVSNGYEMSADLTMKGVTKPIMIAFMFTPAGNGGLFISQFAVNREDFKVGSPGGSVGKEVNIKLEIPVTK